MYNPGKMRSWQASGRSSSATMKRLQVQAIGVKEGNRLFVGGEEIKL